MAHVFGPISRGDVAKLLDLDHEYADYHLVLNELIFAVLPTVLRSTALTLYEESADLRLKAVILDETADPAPQLAVSRTLAEKHRKLHPSYTDAILVQDLYSVLRSSAAVSPYVTPLYQVVLRELNANTPFTCAAPALRVSKALEPPLLDDPAQPAAAAMSIRLRTDDRYFPGDAPLGGDPTEAPPPAFFSVDDGDDTWPAFRSSPIWLPSFSGSAAANLSITDVTSSEQTPAAAP
ncbi:hypothetical protein CYMTET_24568 [Cymbomonas tetramitiformis]|uniref:Uncharacterized protein n=1 Tax=Cymbomonas tetramitiformis TaxID=36881 RepID=A0AAE0F5Q7_9CHLO|nr:hypothetical protein CYMTET_52655 [Cymbomonas tetramitiformis]KAK3252803.1 hypothetical protein CYMTET_37921 [Cymbomonas tetramitiformis]KAK3266849.1 hypothetical protein CYMTET_24568 [Cymbomonas tetramitiformis]